MKNCKYLLSIGAMVLAPTLVTLAGAASPKLCSDFDLRAQAQGFECVTSKEVTFRLVKKVQHAGAWSARGGVEEFWLDVDSSHPSVKGAVISDSISDWFHGNFSTYDEAQAACEGQEQWFSLGQLSPKLDWSLPSAYPQSLNGKQGLPDQDSDFTALENDGFEEVVPNVEGRYFWSSTYVPYWQERNLVYGWQKGKTGWDDPNTEIPADAPRIKWSFTIDGGSVNYGSVRCIGKRKI